MKCKYRVRWFSSKGAFLVLLWTLLVIILCSLFYEQMTDLFDVSNPSNWLYFCPFSFSAPQSGWLADAKFWNYKVSTPISLTYAVACECQVLGPTRSNRGHDLLGSVLGSVD